MKTFALAEIRECRGGHDGFWVEMAQKPTTAFWLASGILNPGKEITYVNMVSG